MKTLHVLGAPLLVTTYDELAAQCLAWTRAPRCFTLEFVNTHIVTAMRHDPAFRAIIATYDHLLPDGMPLVWCLNRAGAACGTGSMARPSCAGFWKPRRPALRICWADRRNAARGCGKFSTAQSRIALRGRVPRLVRGGWSIEAEVRVMEELHTLAPDFIWVGFGTPKQQAWAARHKAALRRGVVLTVGFAFDANAGLKPDAPIGWQRAGLTWLFRLISEPRRLGPRYLRFNTLFLYYLLADGLRGRAWGKERPSAA